MTDQTKLDIALMKKDITSVTNICEKMDDTIDKMQQVAVDLSRIVSLQEQKHEMQDRTNISMQKKIDADREDVKKEIVDINKKIDQVESNLAEKIERVSNERKIGYTNLSATVEDSENKILEEISKLKESLNKKIYEIDIWRYTVMGGIVLASFLITKFVDLAKLFR
jgi:chromosome segregation ATPase